MDPNEIESRKFGVIVRVAGVPAEADVARVAVDAELVAHVPARARSGHRVEDVLRPEVPKQVLDELARAVARVARVPVGTPVRLVVQTGEPGDGTAVPGRRREDR